MTKPPDSVKLFHFTPCACTIDSRDGSIVDYDCGREPYVTLRACIACGAQWTLPAGLVESCHACGSECR